MTLSPGSSGSAVGDTQQFLVEQGAALAEAELLEEYYGATTVIAVREFQQRMGLLVDGIAGPKTLAALRAPVLHRQMPTVRGWRYDTGKVRAGIIPVVLAAVGDLGTEEVPPGSNAGPGLRKYRGHEPGQAWCAYALGFWLSHHEAGCPWGVLGSAYKILTYARLHGLALAADQDVEPGDVWLRMRTAFAGHVSLVVGVDQGAISTVGGNEGNRVSGLIRRREDATAIIRPFPL